MIDSHITIGNWLLEDLDSKTVEMKVDTPHKKCRGIWTLCVYPPEDGKHLVEIQAFHSPYLKDDHVYFPQCPLTQAELDRIQRHPDPSVAAFQCILQEY